MGATTYPPLAELLADHGLTGAAEESFQADGWSGARLSRLVRADGARFVIKRDSLALDWIARTTGDDPDLREALLAAAAPRLPPPARLPHLGVARDGDLVALLMPDLAASLLHWEAPIALEQLDRVLGGLAALHADPWHRQLPTAFPWTDLRRRVLLLTRRAAAAYEADGNWVGERFRNGWDAFDRHAPAAATDLIASLTADPAPLFASLAEQPVAGLHGDLKLGNVALAEDGGVDLIDWQMTLVAPVAVELGWFLVCNVAGLTIPPDDVLERYRLLAGLAPDDRWARERDLALVIGLLLRGWRKGLDADAGLTTACGWPATEDLAWWADAATEAARRAL
ncbi:MAG TPA: hypothetical protein VM451_07940 [Candidatus Limnocylindria bacterium]|nr:hypothetical protein [Candidatus Limnocylindria bacterium]